MAAESVRREWVVRCALAVLLAPACSEAGEASEGPSDPGAAARAVPVAVSVLTPAAAPAPIADPAALAYVEGLEALRDGRFDDAVAAFTRAVDADSESVGYRIARGVTHLFAERPEAAIPDLDRAMHLSGQSREARLWRAAADRMQANFFTETYPQTTNDPFESRVGDAAAFWGQTFRKVEQGYEPTAEKQAEIRARLADVRRWFVERKLESSGAAELRWERGKALCDRGAWSEAAGDVAAALALRPDDVTVLRYHAGVRLALGDAATARSLFTRVLTADTTSAPSYAGRAVAAARTGDARRARADLAEAERLDPAAARTAKPAVDAALAAAPRLERPERLRYDETYQDGLRERERRVAAKAKDPDALAELAAWLYEHLDVPRERVEPRGDPRLFRHQTPATQAADAARAEELCDRALAADARHVTALVVKAAVRMWNLRYADAETLLVRALDEAPTDARILALLSRVMDVAASQKRSVAAALRTPTVVGSSTRTEGDYEVHTTWWRQPSQAELDRASRLDAEADVCLKRAHEALVRAAKANAGTARGAYLTGVVERRLGNAEAARAAFAEATVKDPSMVDAWFQLAGISSELGRADEALVARAAAYDRIETTAAPHLSAAWRAIERTQFRTAHALLDEAARHDPDDARIAAFRGAALAGDGKPAEAAAQFERALAVERTRASLCGTSLAADATGPVPTHLLGLALTSQRRLAEIATERGDAAGAVARLRESLSLEPRLERGQEMDDLPRAMLPVPGQPPGVLPESFPLLAHVAWARVRAGEAHLAAKSYAEAKAVLDPVFRYGPSRINGKGADRFREQELRALVVLCRIALAEGRIEDANRIAMGLPRMRHGVGPSKGQFPDLERIGQELADEVARRVKEAEERGDERWDREGVPDPAKAEPIVRRITDESGLAEFSLGDGRAANAALPFTSLLRQAVLQVVAPKSNRWRENVRVSVQIVREERERTAEAVARFDRPEDPRAARRGDADLYRRLLTCQDTALALLRSVCIDHGYPAEALDADLATKSGAPGPAPFTGDASDPEARLAALCERVGVPYLRRTDRHTAAPESMTAYGLRLGYEAITAPKTAQWRPGVVGALGSFAQQVRQGEAQTAELDRRLADLRRRAKEGGRGGRGLDTQIERAKEQKAEVAASTDLARRAFEALRDEAVAAGYPRDALDADLRAAGLTR